MPYTNYQAAVESPGLVSVAKGGHHVSVDVAAGLDRSLWEEDGASPLNPNLALPLLQLLEQEQRLSVWLAANRPCLVLADLVRVPSAAAAARSTLTKLRSAIAANATTSSGAKVLLEAIDQL
jgi:hypothetical protein